MCIFSKPKMPALPAAVKIPELPAKSEEQNAEDARRVSDNRKKQLAAQAGAASTVATGGRGLLEDGTPYTRKKTLGGA